MAGEKIHVFSIKNSKTCLAALSKIKGQKDGYRAAGDMCAPFQLTRCLGFFLIYTITNEWIRRLECRNMGFGFGDP